MPLYVGIEGEPRAVCRMYVGVGDVARKVKRAYVGVGGIARLFFAAEPVLRTGTGPQMSASHFHYGLARAGNYVVCAGGTNAAQNTEAFNEEGVLSSVEALPENVSYLSGVTASDGTAVFAGGFMNNMRKARVYRYTENLAREELPPLQSARGGTGAASVGNWVLIAGGVSNTGKRNDVDAYNADTFARTTVTGMYTPMDAPAGVGNCAYALFGGGYANSASQASASVTAYNASLVRTEPAGLSAARCLCAGAAAGDLALIVGGNTSSAGSDIVDAYDASLVHSTSTLLSGCSAPAGGALGEMGVVVNTENRTTQFFDAELICRQGKSFDAGVSVIDTRVGVPLGARLWFARGVTTLYTYFS